MKIAAFLLLFVSGLVSAQTNLLGGQPHIVFELEKEKTPDNLSESTSVTLYPGIRWKEGWLNQLEFMLKHERENEIEGSTVQHTNVSAFGVRVRKNVHISGNLNGFVRVLAGRKIQPDLAYTYAYVEPALTYELGPVELYAGYRFVRTIDGTDGRNYDALRFGPGWDLNAHNEIELRLSRSWFAQTRLHRSDSIEIEYTYKF